MFEREMDPASLAGKSNFVAAFASTNLGDVSPNTLGPRCIDTGLPCDLEHSTCDGRTQNCIAFGPGADMFESTKIIAERQFRAALDLFSNRENYTELSGPVQFSHQWVNMTNYRVELADGSTATTCPPPTLGLAVVQGPLGSQVFPEGDFPFLELGFQSHSIFLKKILFCHLRTSIFKIFDFILRIF